MESGGFEEDGIASLSCDVPILCPEWVLIVPNVPEIGRYGAGSAVQHRVLLAFNDFTGSHYRSKGREFDGMMNGSLANSCIRSAIRTCM